MPQQHALVNQLCATVVSQRNRPTSVLPEAQQAVELVEVQLQAAAVAPQSGINLQLQMQGGSWSGWRAESQAGSA